MDAQGGRKWMSQLKKREGMIPPSTVLLFYWALNRLDDTHPHWGREIFFIQCIESNSSSSRNSLMDTTRNNVLLVLGVSLSSVKLTHKINHHTIFKGYSKENGQKKKQ